MVRKCVLICRAFGLPTTDGTTYFNQMQRCSDGWHFSRTDSSVEKMNEMLEDSRNMGYGMFPQGCFSRARILLPPLSEMPAQAGFPDATPAQAGLPSEVPMSPAQAGASEAVSSPPLLATSSVEVPTPYAQPMSSMGWGSEPVAWPLLGQVANRLRPLRTTDTSASSEPQLLLTGASPAQAGAPTTSAFAQPKSPPPNPLIEGQTRRLELDPEKPLQDHHRTVFPCFATARARAWWCWMDAFGAS